MDASEARRRAALFRRLHEGPEVLVVPNPWDAGTARLLENAGFAALHTTSAGLAFSLGRRDGDGAVTADETFAHVRAIVAATRLPVTADLENGFGASPETVAATIRRAVEVGLAGASIEDATYDRDRPLYERPLAAERMHAAVEAARAADPSFVLTARAENFIRGRPDLDDVLERLGAYERAGADVLYAPGLPDEQALRRVCGSFGRPVHYVAGIGGKWLSVEALRAVGVRRVSVGASLARCALTAMIAAAREIREHGTFAFVEGLPSVAALGELIDP
jgi:2-methylisocitrate lyase-like PEP mutase family enzyme